MGCTDIAKGLKFISDCSDYYICINDKTIDLLKRGHFWVYLASIQLHLISPYLFEWTHSPCRLLLQELYQFDVALRCETNFGEKRPLN